MYGYYPGRNYKSKRISLSPFLDSLRQAQDKPLEMTVPARCYTSTPCPFGQAGAPCDYCLKIKRDLPVAVKKILSAVLAEFFLCAAQ
jgi:hypothetical protein